MILLLLAACVDGDSETAAPIQGVTIDGDFQLTVAVDDVNGPTQFFIEPDGSFVVATINGGERDGVGQVIRISPEGERTVLFESLDKPTGVIGRGDEIWVMEATRLSRGPSDPSSGQASSAPASRLQPVAENLPNNGRSQGTLTLTPDGEVLFDTSGTKRGSTVIDGSGRLWTVGDDGTPIELASGFKHAYAHWYDPDGVLWATEMSDGSFDGQTAQDELLQVVPGVDHGWPYCVGQNRPVAEYGQQNCDGVPETVVAFEPGATPTGLAPSPFGDGDPAELFVTLWTAGQVVSVPGGAMPAGGTTYTPVLSGLSGPQHLLSHDGDLYLSEFGANRILKLSES